MQKFKDREKIERRSAVERQEQRREKEKEESREKIPPPERERVVKEQLEREIKKMEEIKPDLKEKAKRGAERIEALNAEGKIKHLLKAAETEGLGYAVEMARQTNDPYILDLLHDTLAKNGLYKKFGK